MTNSTQEDYIKIYLRKLGKDSDDKTRRTTLKQIHGTFFNSPPSEEDLKTRLSDLRKVVMDLSSVYIPSSYEPDGAFKGILGEEPIYASAVLYDTNLPKYIEDYTNSATFEFDKYDPNDHGDLYIPQYLIMKNLLRIARNWQKCGEEKPPVLDNPILRNISQCVVILDKKVTEELHKLKKPSS